MKTIATFMMLLLVGCHGTRTFVSGEGLAEPTGQAASPPCNDLEQLGTEVFLTANSAAPPSPKGGSIADGTYVLTSSVLYTKDSPSGTRMFDFGKATMQVKGGKTELVITSPSGKDRRSTVSRTQSGHRSTSTTLCSSPTKKTTTGADSTDYTATKDSVMFISPGPAGTIVSTYTRL